MHRITLSIDVEDSEFDKALEKAVKGYARGMTRKLLEEECGEEVKRILANQLKSGNLDHTVSWALSNIIDEEARNVLNGFGAQEIKNILEERIDLKIRKDYIDKTIEETIKSTVEKAVPQAIMELLAKQATEETGK